MTVGESKSKLARLRVGVSERYTDHNGVQQERTEWVRVTAWRHWAALAEQFLRKGDAVFVAGRIRTRTYTDDKDVKRYMTEVEATDLQPVGRVPRAANQRREP